MEAVGTMDLSRLTVDEVSGDAARHRCSGWQGNIACGLLATLRP